MTDKPKKTLSGRALLQVNLPESQYQADMALFEDGQRLTDVLLKLSLGGIVVVGALLSFPTRTWPDDCLFKILLTSSVIVFAFTVGFSLLRRYFASGSMFHHIEAMKKASFGDPALEPAVENDIAMRDKKHKCANILLITTSVFLTLGAALLGGAFIRLLFLGVKLAG